MSQTAISYNLAANVLFSKLNPGESILLLCDKTSEYKLILKNLMQAMGADNYTVVYVSHKTNEINCGFNIRKCAFNVLNANSIYEIEDELKRAINAAQKSKSGLLLIADWSNLNPEQCDIFLSFIKRVIDNYGVLPQPRRGRANAIRQNMHFLMVNAFETAKMSAEFMQRLVLFHQRVYLFQENCHSFCLPVASPSSHAINPQTHILPRELLEKIAKDNLELIMLLFLEKGSKSGYQLLKEIAQHFHCILSQGTLYPLLYQMEKENKIVKQNGKGREIIYSLAPQTETSMGSMKETSLQAYQHMSGFLTTDRVWPA
ncbi:MAG: PadR family transcriptional regulator [Nanoarchaeota archaeon]|nr:PadR family transcriptional regulator [Nanoarchaeota archaeon]